MLNIFSSREARVPLMNSSQHSQSGDRIPTQSNQSNGFSMPLDDVVKDPCEWNDEQKAALMDTVKERKGHIPTEEKFKKKWMSIASQLTDNIMFQSYQMPHFYNLYKIYLSFKIEVMKKHNVKEDNVDLKPLQEAFDSGEISLYEWNVLVMAHQYYQEIYADATDQARRLWKMTSPRTFNVFIISALLLNLFEIFLIGLNPDNEAVFALQCVVLANAVNLYFIGIAAIAIYFPPDFDLGLAGSSLMYAPLRTCGISQIVIERIERARLCIDRETFLEGFWYGVGITFLAYGYRGLAMLRVFRIFRFFGYFKYVEDNYTDDEIPANRRPFSLVKAGKLCAFYMDQLYEEFVTQKSLGGLLVMMLFFFVTYTIAVVFKNQKGTLPTPSSNCCPNGNSTCTPCLLLRDCFMTMLSLVVYDGCGLDYLQAVADDDSSGLLFLLFLYLIFNGFMLINGLLGIFGQVFTTQDEQVMETFGKIENIERRLESTLGVAKKLSGQQVQGTGAAPGQGQLNEYLRGSTQQRVGNMLMESTQNE